MGEPKVNFGDKLFLYGHLLHYLEEFDDFEYNSVMGYMTVGGYIVSPVETDRVGACVSGYVVDILSTASLAPETPFHQMELIDITDKLSLSLPLPSGTKVWMPTTAAP